MVSGRDSNSSEYWDERTEVLQQLKKRRQDETGFTLIELMVVVLIMGILMAIAIPTFLSTRNSAHDAGGKSNATNAYINEKSYYASNQTFLAAQATDTGNTLDDSLPWGVGLANVAAYVNNGATTQSLLVVAGSSSGDCFYIADTETTGAAYIGYAETTGNTSACVLPTTNPPVLSAAPTSGSAAGHTTTTAPATFYSSF